MHSFRVQRFSVVIHGRALQTKNKQAHTHTSSDPPSWNERTAVIAVYTTIPLCPLQGRTRMQARKL